MYSFMLMANKTITLFIVSYKNNNLQSKKKHLDYHAILMTQQMFYQLLKCSWKNTLGKLFPKKALFEKIRLKLFIVKHFLNFEISLAMVLSGSQLTKLQMQMAARYIANFIVGKLNSEPSKPIVLSCGELTKCNHQTIAGFFNDAMSLLCHKAYITKMFCCSYRMVHHIW